MRQKLIYCYVGKVKYLKDDIIKYKARKEKSHLMKRFKVATKKAD